MTDADLPALIALLVIVALPFLMIITAGIAQLIEEETYRG